MQADTRRPHPRAIPPSGWWNPAHITVLPKGRMRQTMPPYASCVACGRPHHKACRD